jgi:hypothetical protein
MKTTTLTALAIACAAALLLLLPPRFDAQAKKKDWVRQLELLKIAALIEPHHRPFSEKELNEIRRAIPSIKADNPKLYKDPSRTRRILLLYMILDEIEHAARPNGKPASLVGKSPGELARRFVNRVYNSSR